MSTQDETIAEELAAATWADELAKARKDLAASGRYLSTVREQLDLAAGQIGALHETVRELRAQLAQEQEAGRALRECLSTIAASAAGSVAAAAAVCKPRIVFRDALNMTPLSRPAGTPPGSTCATCRQVRDETGLLAHHPRCVVARQVEAMDRLSFARGDTAKSTT